MAKKIKQEYGIKYPITCDNNNGTVIDLNKSYKDKIRSILMHIVFTPKGQKLRDPDFGTDLIKFIFEPNMSEVHGEIRENVNNAISRYLPNTTVNGIDVLKSEDDSYQVYVKISYSVKTSSGMVSDNIIVEV